MTSDFHKVYRDNYDCRVEVKNSRVYKTLKRNNKRFDEVWLNTYREFHSLYNNVPEIYEIVDNTIVMEHLEGKLVYDIISKTDDTSIIPDIISQTIELSSSFFEFKKLRPSEKFFFHRDLWLGNLIWTDNKVKMIDPDSFVFADRINYSNFLTLHTSLTQGLDTHYDKNLYL